MLEMYSGGSMDVRDVVAQWMLSIRYKGNGVDCGGGGSMDL